MAVLKKGAKGKDVKNIQTLLNKAGAKPVLAVDGIFGPLTDKQARDFQKKLKLKVDGKVGTQTQAALKLGRPLPKLDLEFTNADMQESKANKKRWESFAKTCSKAAKDIGDLAQLANKQAVIAEKNAKETQVHFDKTLDLINKLIATQADFDAQLERAPEKAERLAKKHNDLALQKFDAFDKILPKIQAIHDSVELVQKKLKETSKQYDDQLALVRKVNDGM